MTSVLNMWRGPWPGWGRVSPGRDDAFGERVVIGIADTADRGVDACLGQPLGVADRQVLAASVTIMDQLLRLARRALADGLVQGVEHEAGCH